MQQPVEGPAGSTDSPPLPSLVHLLSLGLFALVGLQVIRSVASLVSMDTLVRNAVQASGQNPALTTEAAENAARGGIIFGAVINIVLAVFFAWLAVMVRQGRNWARITSTVLLPLGILFSLFAVFGSQPALFTLLTALMLILEIAVLVMLWLGPSNEYFGRGSQGA